MAQMQDRRMDRRLLCADLLELIWNEPEGGETRRIGNLEDISSCGMSLQLERPVHVGTRVRTMCGSKELSGIVRYALYNDGAYFIGVEFDPESRWSPRNFVPEHMLDPREVLDKDCNPEFPGSARSVLIH